MVTEVIGEEKTMNEEVLSTEDMDVLMREAEEEDLLNKKRDGKPEDKKIEEKDDKRLKEEGEKETSELEERLGNVCLEELEEGELAL